MHEEGLVETWHINNRINTYLLGALEPAQLDVPLTKGKSVRAQFAHIHNVRLMWIKAAAPDLLDSQQKTEGEDLTGAHLTDLLNGSADSVATLLERSIAAGGKVKNFKPHVAAFVGYLIAHEANHRGQVEIALRQAGKPLSDKVAYGMWEWGSR